jgi:hypothetical protein
MSLKKKQKQKKKKDADPKTKKIREGVYIVCQSIEFSDPNQANNKLYNTLKNLKTKLELEEFILLQHWGIRVGDHSYHLYKTDQNRLAVSLQHMDNATLEIPVWRTTVPHTKRVGMGSFVFISLIGFCANDNDVSYWRNSAHV